MNKWEPQKIEAWLIIPRNDEAPFEILGEAIHQDANDPEINTELMFYFKTTEGLKEYSAYDYIVEKVTNE